MGDTEHDCISSEKDEVLAKYAINYEEYVDVVKDILKDSGAIYLDYNGSPFVRNCSDYFYSDCHLSDVQRNLPAHYALI